MRNFILIGLISTSLFAFIAGGVPCVSASSGAGVQFELITPDGEKGLPSGLEKSQCVSDEPVIASPQNVQNSKEVPVTEMPPSKGSRSAPRTVLLESFTSSTCGPCAPGNVVLKNVLAQFSGPYAIIKYQMSWPGAGDPYYTAEGNVKRTNPYVQVSSVPNLVIDGGPYKDPNNTYCEYGINSNAVTLSHLTNAQSVPANIELDAVYTVTGKTVNATVTITPLEDIPGANLKLFIAIAEKVTTKNTGTNGETEFLQVMKKFMPDALGIDVGALTADVPVSFTQEWEFKGNYRLPPNASSPINHNTEHSVENFNNLTIVAWVQNTSTKNVLQAFAGPRANQPYINFVTVTDNGGLQALINGVPAGWNEFVDPGTEVNFIATPNAGYAVKEWRVNGTLVQGNTTNYLDYTMASNSVKVTVDFQATHHKVTYSAVNSNGALTATVDGTEITSNDYIERGKQVIFTAAPEYGYRVKEWRRNGIVIQNNKTNEYIHASLDNDITVTVEFEYAMVNVNFSVVNEYGTITATVDDDVIEPNDLVLLGSKVIFTAVPDANYEVSEWRHNGLPIQGNQTNEYIISQLVSETNVTVTFRKQDDTHFTVKYSVVNEHGTLTATVDGDPIASDDLVEKEAEVIFTATPVENYEVKEWKLNGTPIPDNTTNEYIITSLNNDVDVTVEFQEIFSVGDHLMSNVKLYPNPFTNSLTITNAENVRRVTVINILGQTVKEINLTGTSTASIDADDFASGIYIVTIQAVDGERIVRRIAKQEIIK